MDFSNSQLYLGSGLDYDKEEQKNLNFRNAWKYINLNMLKDLKL